MKNTFVSILIFCLAISAAGQNLRTETILKDWEFRKGHDIQAVEGWETVSVPHDWAIYGPFDRSNDLQTVAVVQNREEIATVKTGRTGGLPYVGKGAYRRSLDIASSMLDGRRHILFFDGAMSEAQVYVNGEKVCFWPYGYNSFHCDVTDILHEGPNDIIVLLENRSQSSRWYPGAGLYRKVRHITLPQIHVPVWGTYITTPYVGADYASVSVKTKIEGLGSEEAVTLKTKIINAGGVVVAQRTDTRKVLNGEIEQIITVPDPKLWSPEEPVLYKAETEVYTGGKVYTDYNAKHYKEYKVVQQAGNHFQDKVVTRFGIRTIEIRPDKGFFLNGELRKFRGVCLHHDLGPLGAAVNKAAIRRQLTILKDMGCDAIRTSHNMPAEELIDLCDEMGFMVMAENFDEWDAPKCKNGYHRWFNVDSGDGRTWAERDMINLIHHFRNNPSVVMWSIGNEVPSQWAEGGLEVAAWLQNIYHAEDPGRPVTCGMDQFDAVVNNGFAAQLDVVGFNYKVGRYQQAYDVLPQRIILGSETASTVSSRGVYHFPIKIGPDQLDEDHQSCSYDTGHCDWSNIPDEDLAADEDYEWCIGQFVWTGFDYLGEPSPYDTDAWPNHSSVFGIVDLASIPKDRYYLYRSQWNKNDETLHILPHWNWKGREGEVTPVFVYTSYPSAELFVNGVSQGVKSFAVAGDETPCLGEDAMKRFRLMWDDVVYQPGELSVVAYDDEGKVAAEKTVRTAGKAAAIKLTPDRKVLKADGEDLCYLNVSLVDKDGNPVPVDNRLVKVKVSGAGSFKAIANGDPTCLEPFHKPQMHLFSGQLTVLIQSSETPGDVVVEVSAKGVKKSTVVLSNRQENSEPEFWLGADLGWITEYEANGHKFYNRAGEERECTALMKELGLNAVRHRVWVDPSKYGNWCSKEDLLVKCQRAKALGMEILVDFHYSDWWADPAKQNIPASWSGHDYEQMKKDLRAHTVEVLTYLKDNGITPKWIQVGNETRNGFLWSVKSNEKGWPILDENGKTTITESMGHVVNNPEQYAGFFATGYDACKSVFPDAIVMVHLDNGFDKDLYDFNLGVLKSNGAKWDMIGMSLYPYWALDGGFRDDEDQTITDCIANIRYVSEKFGCDVMIVETGFYVDEDDPVRMERSRSQLARVIRESINETEGRCKGVFYWEPECKPSQYRLGAFTEDGYPTVIMDAFSDWSEK